MKNKKNKLFVGFIKKNDENTTAKSKKFYGEKKYEQEQKIYKK